MTFPLHRLNRAGARLGFFGLLALVGSILLVPGKLERASAIAKPIAPQEQAQPSNAQTPSINVVRQGFPAAKSNPNEMTKSDTAWEIEWDLTRPDNRPSMAPGVTMRIRSAKFMWKNKAGQPQWITVARMLELGEIYVPYDNGYTAFMDVHHHPFYITPARKEFLGPNCVAPGEVLKSPNSTWNETVHKEVHDDGVRWMSAETNERYEIADRVRRGEKLILWSTYFGANYRYIIEYDFRDDGMITCRLGFTGRNLIPRQADMNDTHLHVGCWRMEFDLGDPTSKLGGPRDNDIVLVRRIFDEATERFHTVVKPFAKNSLGQACEGSVHWRANEFTTVRVQSRVRKNTHGRPVAFDVIPHRFGASEQLQSTGGYFGADSMDWVNNDFWVTRTESGFTNYIDVAQYASQKRPLDGYPTTIWHSAPALHVTRGEDYGDENGTNNFTGVALTGWAEFHIKPRDLFDSSPLYKSTMRPLQFRFD
jgi:hypothetical protein